LAAQFAVANCSGTDATGTSQIFSDVRTYWSPDAARMDARAVIRCGIVPRFRIGMDAAGTGWKPEGVAKDGFIHLINSGATRRDARFSG
jgi:L-fucose isomerase